MLFLAATTHPLRDVTNGRILHVMLTGIAATAFYIMTAVFADDSCMTAAFREGDNCRLSDIEVWCPDPNGPCEARERAIVAEATIPTCEQVDAITRTGEFSPRPLRQE